MKEHIRILYMVPFLGAFLMFFQFCQSVKRIPVGENLEFTNRIAIATVNDHVGSEISGVAGRASYYLIFDRNGVFLKSLENLSQNQRQGASSGVVDMLKKEYVKTVVAGKFGDKMTGLFKANKIEYHIRAGIARDILETIIQNKRSKRNE